MTEKINRIAVVATLLTPVAMYPLISLGVKPTIKPTIIGTRINTIAGALFRPPKMLVRVPLNPPEASGHRVQKRDRPGIAAGDRGYRPGHVCIPGRYPRSPHSRSPSASAPDRSSPLQRPAVRQYPPGAHSPNTVRQALPGLKKVVYLYCCAMIYPLFT